ncbi:Alpha/beta hydrolase fold-3, partial [Lipomyces tetrasporus]
VLVNFHGGGFCIGRHRDDARWATTIVEAQNAVVVSVGYRLAPEYPDPVAIDDGVDAVLWIWNHADEFNLDRSRIAFSGFSAGGTLSFTVAFRLDEVVLNRMPTGRIRLAGIVASYPAVDITQTRAERKASNHVLGHKDSVPDSIYEFLHASCLYPQPSNLASPYLSPGLAEEELLAAAFPDRLMTHNCEWDQLLVEAEMFQKRLRVLGKEVGGEMVPGVPCVGQAPKV